MEEYRGYVIEVVENDEKQYPYKAIARKEKEQIKHKGYSKLQAIDLVKGTINLEIARQCKQ
ncbi:hypothetical protein [Clostridium estertheticum]|uniref:Uncharacterized protein n=2 Tax=Clostridium estertheticum TaxID=238834 RepID=A0A1J0GJ11_9CLOT|nr:hypothetical protein [Clostridium estertheticum]APC41321.1 hypothetical protein A7L45_15165 [Clostridium estertheticum subsp. estertheticum]MBU3073003.1 hypothetical protein [Clostridium estertheticum]MBU3162960.1 hypothetical protein [Clostridium estertheticum]MBU3172813.1 hypothetical protein [Clostridium estertheticum]MBU3183696.1 hypothetical protein [Clostridium estertheticum]